jgi:hypothetical protein
MLWLSLGAGAALAAQIEVGLGGRVLDDQADSGKVGGATRLEPGPALVLPARLALGHGAWLRSTLVVGTVSGHDRVEWLEADGQVRVESHSHPTRVTALWALAGPELRPSLGGRLSPILGVDLGAAWVQNWHGFGGATAVLVPEEDGAHPFSDVVVPAAGVHGGLSVGLSERVAVEVESGYTVSFLNQVPLRKAPEGLQAVRASYGLNVAHLSVAAIFTFGGVEPSGGR